jgi:uncharacterized Zn-binding protein involved in type VI secretion
MPADGREMMVRTILAGVAALALASTATAAPKAAPAKPAAAAKAAPVRCTDPKTKRFIKCGSSTAAAKPAAAASAAVTKDKNGRCHVASGPKKGQFTKCP